MNREPDTSMDVALITCATALERLRSTCDIFQVTRDLPLLRVNAAGVCEAVTRIIESGALTQIASLSAAAFDDGGESRDTLGASNLFEDFLEAEGRLLLQYGVSPAYVRDVIDDCRRFRPAAFNMNGPLSEQQLTRPFRDVQRRLCEQPEVLARRQTQNRLCRRVGGFFVLTANVSTAAFTDLTMPQVGASVREGFALIRSK